MALATRLLLTTSADADPEKVVAALGTGPDVRVLLRQPDQPTTRVGVPRAAPDLFGVACELRHVDARAALTAFTGVAARLGGLVDPDRSAALAGQTVPYFAFGAIVPPDIQGGAFYTLSNPVGFNQTFTGAGGQHAYSFNAGPVF